MITTHRLSEDAFLALASGLGGSATVLHLREVQRSKHLMLLRAVAEGAVGADPDPLAITAFRAGYRLLAAVQAADPEAVAWLLDLAHIGGWAHDCLIRIDKGSMPDLGYLAWVAAAAAVRAGIQFELDVPVRQGRVLLPGLGGFRVATEDGWICLRSDGKRLTSDDARIDAPCVALVPDDGSGEAILHWQGTPMVRATADGIVWRVLLETSDRYLDRYTLPMATTLTVHEVAGWRRIIESAWEILVRYHSWTAGPVADGVSVIVPLIPQHDTDLVGGTSPAAFGAIATSWPHDPVIMAETLVHEFQHLKLCGLMDMLPLIRPGGEKVYAPWRQDPRPTGGLLQGVYAHLGIARFWDAQRHVEADPDHVLRAEVMYERWRPTIEQATSTLLDSGCLTPTGIRFVGMIRDQGRSLASRSVSAAARDIAEQVALDHWLTWQLRHTAIDAGEVARLAASYQRGEPLGKQVLPEFAIAEDTRRMDSTIRSRLLDMRYLEPWRYRRLRATDMPGLTAADRLLANDDPRGALDAYRDHIKAAADPLPDAWVGLALAIHRLPPSPLRQVFATKLPLMFDMYTRLLEEGILTDPFDLAAWLL